MSQQELEDVFADSVDFLGSGGNDQIVPCLKHAGSNEAFSTVRLRFDDAESTTPEGFQLFVVTEGRDRQSRSPDGIENRHPLRRPHLCPINRHADITHGRVPFLMTILWSSGMGGGTGSPETLLTASKREGHTSKQMPHASHFSWSMM